MASDGERRGMATVYHRVCREGGVARALVGEGRGYCVWSKLGVARASVGGGWLLCMEGEWGG